MWRHFLPIFSLFPSSICDSAFSFPASVDIRPLYRPAHSLLLPNYPSPHKPTERPWLNYHCCFMKHALTSFEPSLPQTEHFLPSKQLRSSAVVSLAWYPQPFLACQPRAVFVFLRTLPFVWITSAIGAQFARERTSGFQEWQETGVVLWWGGLHLSSLSTEIRENQNYIRFNSQFTGR